MEPIVAGQVTGIDLCKNMHETLTKVVYLHELLIIRPWPAKDA